MKELYFVYHLPKTGGQTIRDHLDSKLERDRDFLHLGKWDRSRPLDFDDVAALSDQQRADLRAVGGHPLTRDFGSLFPERVIREVVLVREPASRLVSHYNFRATMCERDGRPVPSFDEFNARFAPNPLTGFLARRLVIPHGPTMLSGILAALSSIWMVGTTESLDDLTPTLFSCLGLDPEVALRTNVSGDTIDRHQTLDPELADRLRAEAPLDVMLYAACQRLERQTMIRLGLADESKPRRPLGFAPE